MTNSIEDRYCETWVRTHYRKIHTSGKEFRQCIHPGCEKLYAYRNSTRVLKKHWELHESGQMGEVKKYTFSNDKLINHIICYIIKKQREYSVVEDDSFLNMLRTFGDVMIPDRKAVSDLILKSVDDVELRVKRRLDGEISVAVTLDIWTTKSFSTAYTAMTAHYISADMQMFSLLLEFKQLTYPHKGDAIAQFIMGTLKRFDLERKVISFTTDQASNNVSAMQKLELDYNLTNNFDIKFIHCRCVAHIIHLCVKKCLENVGQLLTDIRTVVKVIRSSTMRTEIFERYQKLIDSTKEPLKLKKECETRWNSTFLMLERVFRLKAPLIESYLEIPDIAAVATIDWDSLEKTIEFLRPFFDVTNLISKEKYPTVSLISILLPKMLEHSNNDQEDSDLNAGAKLLAQKLDSYSVHMTKPPIILASLLDPRVKTRFLVSQDSGMAKKTLEKYYNTEDLDDSQESIQSQSIFEDIFVKEAPNEVDRYLSLPPEPNSVDPLIFWKNNQNNFPKLCRLARIVLPIQATSVPSERAFSIASTLDIPKRNRLKPENFRANMLLRSWLNYLDDHETSLDD